MYDGCKRAFVVSEGSVTGIEVVRFSLSVPVEWVVLLFRNRDDDRKLW